MDTLDRPQERTGESVAMGVVGYVMISAGYLLFALGALQIGGLFNVTVGLAFVVGGSLLTFARGVDEGDEELLRLLRDP
jgi:hypothetical protein